MSQLKDRRGRRSGGGGKGKEVGRKGCCLGDRDKEGSVKKKRKSEWRGEKEAERISEKGKENEQRREGESVE